MPEPHLYDPSVNLLSCWNFGTDKNFLFEDFKCLKLDKVALLIRNPPTTSITIFFLFITKNKWHVTTDTWHLTCDKWHVTSDTQGGEYCLKISGPSSYGLRVKVFWRYFHKGWVSESIYKLLSDNGVCRRAPATPGMLGQEMLSS